MLLFLLCFPAPVCSLSSELANARADTEVLREALECSTPVSLLSPMWSHRGHRRSSCASSCKSATVSDGCSDETRSDDSFSDSDQGGFSQLDALDGCLSPPSASNASNSEHAGLHGHSPSFSQVDEHDRHFALQSLPAGANVGVSLPPVFNGRSSSGIHSRSPAATFDARSSGGTVSSAPAATFSQADEHHLLPTRQNFQAATDSRCTSPPPPLFPSASIHSSVHTATFSQVSEHSMQPTPQYFRAATDSSA